MYDKTGNKNKKFEKLIKANKIGSSEAAATPSPTPPQTLANFRYLHESHKILPSLGERKNACGGR